MKLTVEELQVAIFVAEVECLDIRLIFPEDVEVLSAIAYVNLYQDNGACIMDRVPLERYLELLARAQIQSDRTLEEIDELIEDDYKQFELADDMEYLEYIEDIQDLPFWERPDEDFAF